MFKFNLIFKNKTIMNANFLNTTESILLEINRLISIGKNELKLQGYKLYPKTIVELEKMGYRICYDTIFF